MTLEDLAMKAYDAYTYAGGEETRHWWELSETEQDRWREVARTVVTEAAKAQALSALGEES